jgi:hypothetical protein
MKVATTTPSDTVPWAFRWSPTARADEVVGPSGFTKVVDELNWTVSVPVAVSTTTVSPEIEATVPNMVVEPPVAVDVDPPDGVPAAGVAPVEDPVEPVAL